MTWYPDEAARDLLGLLRGMYAAELAKPHPSPARKHQLVALGLELADTMLEARRSAPGSEKYLEAIARAEAVVVRLADLVVVTDGAAPILEAAGQRIRRRRR